MKKTSIFDISVTYSKGSRCLFYGKEFTFSPNKKQNQFSTGLFQTEGNGWLPIK